MRGRSNGGACQIPANLQPLAVFAPNESEYAMPSLFRFLAVVGILAGVVYAGLWSLAHLVEPHPREMTVTIPQERLGK
jgi:hypothetical protein